MSLELGPTREPVRKGDLKLGVGERDRATRFQQVLGLIPQMTKVGTIWQGASGAGSVVRHGKLLSSSARRPQFRAERSFANSANRQVGFYPFRGPDASITLLAL